MQIKSHGNSEEGAVLPEREGEETKGGFTEEVAPQLGLKASLPSHFPVIPGTHVTLGPWTHSGLQRRPQPLVQKQRESQDL